MSNSLTKLDLPDGMVEVLYGEYPELRKTARPVSYGKLNAEVEITVGSI